MTIDNFYSILLTHFTANTFIKATIGNTRSKADALKNVLIKPVKIKEEIKYSFVFRNATNDITKNFSATEALKQIKELLRDDFLNADVFTLENNFHVMQKKTGEVKIVQRKANASTIEISLEHNHQKKRLIGQDNKKYLQALGILSTSGEVKKEMQHKYKQINRYVEIVADVLRDANVQTNLHIVDMGSGKGYLTFALADYLLQQKNNATLVGVEMRKDMVDLCNNIATQSGFTNLQFVQGTIQETNVPNSNVLIALHACDTATDDAIHKGVAANAEIIICAPCCHKQVRKAMKSNDTLHAVTKHGILLERQAELITDALRALWLESKGYKTKVFDFVDVNDTPKNVMIVATKIKRSNAELESYAQQFQELKNMFGVEWCAIEK